MVSRSPLRAPRQDKGTPVRSPRELWLIVAGVCIVGILILRITITGLGSWTNGGWFGQSNYQSRSRGMFRSQTFRNTAAIQTFGTLYHNELSQQYKSLSDNPLLNELVSTLKQMEASGIKTVIYSINWDVAEPEEGHINYRYLDWLMGAACKNTSLKVNFAVDLVTAPQWMWAHYPDAGATDADGRKYGRMSWFHSLGNAAARQFLNHVLTHLINGYSDCIVAVQPVYNNAYQTKYTQEYDAFQDYSAYAMLEYRTWLQAKALPLPLLNIRWGTSFSSWSHVSPPSLHSGDVSGVDVSSRYWDWLRFREEFGARVYNGACAVVVDAGLQCFHRFSEFFSVMDAIYGATMFKHVAASPTTTFLIMDTNFITPYGTRTKPVKMQLYVAAARAYGKSVYFEAAVERLADYGVLREAFRAARTAGADGLGVSHWLTRLEPNKSLTDAFGALPECSGGELVGLFVPLDSCSAFHGSQWEWARTDPLHEFIEDLAKRLYHRCATDVALYVDLSHFLPHVLTFSKVIFVEPVLLYDTAELTSYIAVKAALMQVPHEVLHLPTNVTSGPQLVALQDLAPQS